MPRLAHPTLDRTRRRSSAAAVLALSLVLGSGAFCATKLGSGDRRTFRATTVDLGFSWL